MHSGRIVFSQSMEDLPHIVVFGLRNCLQTEPGHAVSQSRSMNTFTPPHLPGPPVLPVDGGNRVPFDRPCEIAPTAA